MQRAVEPAEPDLPVLELAAPEPVVDVAPHQSPSVDAPLVGGSAPPESAVQRAVEPPVPQAPRPRKLGLGEPISPLFAQRASEPAAVRPAESGGSAPPSGAAVQRAAGPGDPPVPTTPAGPVVQRTTGIGPPLVSRPPVPQPLVPQPLVPQPLVSQPLVSQPRAETGGSSVTLPEAVTAQRAAESPAPLAVQRAADPAELPVMPLAVPAEPSQRPSPPPVVQRTTGLVGSNAPAPVLSATPAQGPPPSTETPGPPVLHVAPLTGAAEPLVQRTAEPVRGTTHVQRSADPTTRLVQSPSPPPAVVPPAPARLPVVARTPEPQPERAPEPVVPAEIVQRAEEPAAVETTTVTAEPPAAPQNQGLNADDLLRKLYDPLLRRLKADLWLDRERRGALTDL